MAPEREVNGVLAGNASRESSVLCEHVAEEPSFHGVGRTCLMACALCLCPALSDLLQWHHRRALPPGRGNVRGSGPAHGQSTHRHHLRVCGHHHPCADHAGHPVSARPHAHKYTRACSVCYVAAGATGPSSGMEEPCCSSLLLPRGEAPWPAGSCPGSLNSVVCLDTCSE